MLSWYKHSLTVWCSRHYLTTLFGSLRWFSIQCFTSSCWSRFLAPQNGHTNVDRFGILLHIKGHTHTHKLSQGWAGVCAFVSQWSWTCTDVSSLTGSYAVGKCVQQIWTCIWKKSQTWHLHKYTESCKLTHTTGLWSQPLKSGRLSCGSHMCTLATLHCVTKLHLCCRQQHC